MAVTTRVLYVDCFSGAAGDMLLGAALDAGLPLPALEAALGSLGVGHELRVTRVLRAGVSATHVEVVARGGTAHSHEHSHDHAHDHAHDHGHGHSHDHRSLADILHLLDHSSLSPAARAHAGAMFRRLAEAEAAIHAMPVEKVHLHEVGALDSIIDIAGLAFALEWFGADEVVASPLNTGSGFVEMAHGRFPVPAPATLRLLTGVPVYSSGIQAEMLTPTGALVITEYAGRFGPLPAMTVDRIGYGAGTRDFDGVPNVVRLVTGEAVDGARPGPSSDAIVKLECEMDDMNPQLFGPVSDHLFTAGALDVFLTAIQMKKGRPGTLLTVLAPPDRADALADRVLRETTTLGVRFEHVRRHTLARRHEEVALPGGAVRIKVAGRGGEIFNASPEFDDCLRVADATGRPVKEVQAEALRAWMERRPDAAVQ